MAGWLVTSILAASLSQPPGGGFPGGPGGPGGGFGGPPGGETRKLLPTYDKDKDGKLNADERAAARKAMAQDGGGRRGGFGGPPGGMGGRGPEPKPGPQVSVGDAKAYPGKSLYDPAVLRTLFIQFDNTKDWEKELEDFYHTDVEVPCTLTVDGKTYKDVGVHFRGSSSYFGVRSGSKRSLNLSMDYGDSKQRLLGSKTINLLNSHDDATMMSSVLFSQLASAHIPTPAANFVKVVINGESWGVYANVQQFDKEFLQQHYKTTKGTRWKVKGSPQARGGLEYLGDDASAYKRVFEIKSKDDPAAWKKLIHLCKVLNTTPVDQLEAALTPIMDIDSLLWFLAYDISLINCDGYWIRSSDFTLYLDEKDKFHVVPHDMNECFRQPMGPGMGGPGGGRGGMMMAMPRPGEIVPGFLTQALNLSDEQKKKLEELQKDTDKRLDALFTPEQRKQWNDMKSAMGGPMGPGGGGFPGVPPGGFGGPPMGPGGGGFPGGPGGGGPGGPGGFAGGPPGMGGGAGGGLGLDPLTGMDDTRKPLRSKVLKVEKFRTQYLKNVYTIANDQLDWKNLGPIVAGLRKLIDAEVKADTKKLSTYEAFVSTTGEQIVTGREMSLKAFAEQRRKALLENAEVKKAAGVK